MPLYKLHDVPRVAPSLGSPVATMVTSSSDSNCVAIDRWNKPSNRVPLQPHPHHLLPSTSSVPSSVTGIAVAKQQQSLEAPPTTLETAHFGHSLYFIEHLFPSKLWRILGDAERCGYANVISWVDNGMAFQIHDRENVIPILEKYFSMSKYKSFLRQLQAYGFQRALPNPKDDPCRVTKPKRDTYRGKWSHKLFRRDKMNLCNKMTRDGKTKHEKDDTLHITTNFVEKTTSNNDTKTTKTTTTGNNDTKAAIVPLTTVSLAAPSPPQSPPHHLSQQLRMNQSLAKYHQHQKDLAATTGQQHAAQAAHQQQQHQQHQLQLIHNRILQHQQQKHHPHAPPQRPPVYHQDPRYPQQQQPPFHHPQQHHLQHRHPQQHHQRHHLHPQHRPLPPHLPAPPGASLSPALLAQVQQQQQEEHHRQQLQMHIKQLKEQQLISSILSARAEAPSGKATPPQPSIAAAAAAVDSIKGDGASILLSGVNYSKNNKSNIVDPSSPTTTNAIAAAAPSSAANANLAATEAVSEAANELRRAELALAERRWRLAEAQERVKKEAVAMVDADAPIAWVQGPSPPVAGVTQSTTEAAQELLSRQQPSVTKHPPPSSSAVGSNNEGSRKRQRLLEGLPFTSLLEDLDNAFKSSNIPAVVSQGGEQQQQSVVGGISKTTNEIVATSDQHKITQEELIRARAAAPMDHQPPLQPSAASGTVSPGPSASEREVIMARINAMEQIRLREHQQQQQQNLGQQQHLLLKIAMAKREELEQRQRIGSSVGDVISTATQNAGVGLAGTSAAANTIPCAKDLQPRNGGNRLSSEIINPPTTSTTAAATAQAAQGLLSKEMMAIFAKTAAAAISSKKLNESSTSNNGSSGSNMQSTEAVAIVPPTTVQSSSEATSSLKPQSLVENVSKEIIPKPATSISEAAAISTSIGSITSEGSQPFTNTPLFTAPTPASSANSNTTANRTFSSSSLVVTTSELEAARALMRIPGTVEQSTRSEQPMVGHWELVVPEDLKKGSSLAKALPEVVTKSASLSYDAYKAMAQKLTPPKVMRIPDGWNAMKEPMYMVVDPANMGAAAQSPSDTSATAHLQRKGQAATTAGAPGIR